MHNLMEKGKKHWKTVEPIAKPLAQQLVCILPLRECPEHGLLTPNRPKPT